MIAGPAMEDSQPATPPPRKPGSAWIRFRGLALVTLAVVPLVVLAQFWLGRDAARQAADLFVDRYYVEVDPRTARELSTGLAQAKIDHELELLAGISAAETSARPSVHYRFSERRPEISPDGRASFLYELSIRFEGSEPLVRMALVTVAQQPGGEEWRTENFSEFEE